MTGEASPWRGFFMGIIRNQQLRPVAEGFDAAADLCLGLVTSKLDRLEERLEAGETLSKNDELLRTEFYALRSKMERELNKHWRAAYGE